MAYNKELKNKIINLYLNDGRTLKSLSAQYGVNQSTICNWVKSQTTSIKNKKEDYCKENLQLKKKLKEVKEENELLKKIAVFFARQIN